MQLYFLWGRSMERLLKAISIFFIAATILLPLKSQAAAEEIYVAWIDIDYMESNPLSGWLEEIKDQLADTSSLFEQLLFPKEDDIVSDAENEELEYGYKEDALNSSYHTDTDTLD